MAARTITVATTEPTTGPLNPRINTFTFADDTRSTAQLAAACVAYRGVFNASVSTFLSVVQLWVKTHPAGAQIPIPFPTDEHDDYRARAAAAFRDFMVPEGGGYGASVVGQGVSAGRGLSLCVNESPINETFRGGRHFLPDVASLSIDASGLFNASVAPQVRAMWRGAFLGETNAVWTGAGDDLGPAIWSPTKGGFTDITDVSVQRLPSMLRSRKR